MLTMSTKAMIASAFLAAFSSSANAENFIFASGVPERSSANSGGVLPLLDAIETATDGRVSFTPILSGQLVSLPGALNAIADGVAPSGYFVTQFTPAELPAASLMAEVTGLGVDPYATMGALNEAFFIDCEACRADFEKLGIAPLFMQSASPLVMQCIAQVETMEDLKGLRVATIGKPETRWAASIGMTPVQSSISDLLSGLQLGMTDCALIGTAWIKSYGLEDTIKSVIEMPQGIISGAVPLGFNADAWARISPQDREAIIDLMPATLWDYVTNAYVLPDHAVKQQTFEKIAYAPGDPALADAWVAFLADEPAALKALAASRGIENGDELIDRIVETFRVWHEDLLPQFDGDRDAFIAIARERIFDKVSF